MAFVLAVSQFVSPKAKGLFRKQQPGIQAKVPFALHFNIRTLTAESLMSETSPPVHIVVGQETILLLDQNEETILVAFLAVLMSYTIFKIKLPPAYQRFAVFLDSFLFRRGLSLIYGQKRPKIKVKIDLKSKSFDYFFRSKFNISSIRSKIKIFLSRSNFRSSCVFLVLILGLLFES